VASATWLATLCTFPTNQFIMREQALEPLEETTPSSPSIIVPSEIESHVRPLVHQQQPIHPGHYAIDLQYKGSNGRTIVDRNAADLADADRMKSLIGLFGSAGLTAILTGNQNKFGLGPIDAGLAAGHANHIHLQVPNDRVPPTLKIRPGQR